jgi:hypothetical protein
MPSLVSFFVAIFNWIPVLHLSHDDEFGALSSGGADRFSLLGLSLGRYKYYFITIKVIKGGYKPSLFCKLDFNSFFSEYPTEVVNGFVGDLSGKTDIEVQNLTEFLKYKIDKGSKVAASGYAKANSYTAIVLVFLGSGSYLYQEILSIQSGVDLYNYLGVILIALSVYYTISCLQFVRLILSVKTSYKSMFKPVRENSDLRTIAKAYYIDWRASETDSKIVVSTVLNIEKYFKRTLTMLVFIFIVLQVSNFESMEKKPEVVVKNESEYVIFDALGTFQTGEFTRLLSGLNEGSNRLFVVSHESNSEKDLVLDFIKLVSPNPDGIVQLEFKDSAISSGSVLIKYEDIQ